MHIVLRKLLRSCQKSTELIDKQFFVPLTVTEKVQLTAHKAICKTCNSYEKQSELIDAVLMKWFNNNKSMLKMDTAKKFEIINTIREL